VFQAQKHHHTPSTQEPETNRAKGVFPMSSHQHTTDDIFSPLGPIAPEEQPTRFIDIHIYENAAPEAEPEDEAIVESHPEPELPSPGQPEPEAMEPLRPARERWLIMLACLGGGGLLVFGILLTLSLLPLWAPVVTVTIVPSSQFIRMTTAMTVTTGPVRGTELPGRALAVITMNQAQTVPTTGKGHQDARVAHGFLTFYNAATYSQIIAAGTLLTGANGVQVITEQDALIPAAQYPTFGQMTIPAQAVLAGPGGNSAAGTIYGPCCRLNVSAVSSAFSGGALARDYPTVTEQDIQAVVAHLTTGLNQSAQAALQTQVHADETLITPVPCQVQVTPDHLPGEEATQVRITVSETCSGTAYQTQAFHTQVTQMITQQAHQQLGDGYTLQGAVQATITRVSRQGQQITLQTTIAAPWGYQFTGGQQAQIKAQIAGKDKAQALQLLLHTPGVQTVSIDHASVPTDQGHIHLVFLAMP
jgi:hypothetical protein